jgi:hypothetical protein
LAYRVISSSSSFRGGFRRKPCSSDRWATRFDNECLATFSSHELGEVTVERGLPAGHYFALLVNFFTATRNSSVSIASMILASSASSCCFTGVTAA